MAGDFDDVRSEFARAGVQVRRGVDTLLHRLTGDDPSRFASAEQTFRETVSLPLYPALRDDEARQVIAAARAVLSRRPSARDEAVPGARTHR
jgi:UDP-4-amino-4-deoxy-L-arabinose-oxoglutarate aminotransferase